MDIKQKWVNDKRAQLKGELQRIDKRGTQLQQELQELVRQRDMKIGELQAVEEVAKELKRKPKQKKEKTKR